MLLMLKRVTTDMQRHMCSVHSKYLWKYEEKLNNWSVTYSHRSSNVIADGNLRFSILTSYNSTNPPLNSVPHIFNMSVLKCATQIAAVSKQIFIQYAVKLHRHSFQDKYVMFNNNFTPPSYCFQLLRDWPIIIKALLVLYPYTRGFFISTSIGTAKCCDIRELWWSICVINHTVFHTDIIA